MIAPTHIRYAAIALGFILCSVGLYVLFFDENRAVAQEVAACDVSYTGVDKKLNCWYELIREKVRTEGIQSAFTVFDAAYAYEAFERMSCHEHAHVVGDTAYYEKYLAVQDFDKMAFPEETKYCGYGFWHGFIEHFVQDRPDPAIVDETCAYFTNRYGETMSDIELTCYHAAGHGFMLDPVENIQREKGKWGDFFALIKRPLEKCEGLDASDHYIQECKIGVFNVIGLWMFDGEYGLTYNTEDPFDNCRKLAIDNQAPCYNEMAQKLDSVSNWDLRNAATFVADIESSELAQRVIGVAAAGMMMRDVNSDQEYTHLEQCREIPNRLNPACLQGVVSGLFEYGEPNNEYVEAISFCESGRLTNEERGACYQTTLTKMKRFYTTDKVERLCTEYTSSFEAFCNKNGVRTGR